jgi:hypothetical protein
MKKLTSEEQLFDYFKKHKKTIKKFYEINRQFDSAEDLCKIAITGSTYRSFVRNEPKIQYGMSKIFKQVACSNFDSDPTIEKNQNLFLKSLSEKSICLFKNLSSSDVGLPKLLKLYNLYANYWVACQLNDNLNNKKSNIRRLKVPLDKYSLTFIRDLYNMQDISVSIQVESDLSVEELENEIARITSEWRIGRLSEEELISTGTISGYVKGSYSTLEGDYDPSSEVTTSIEETND